MTMKDRLPLVADLLMEAAHADNRLHGEEKDAVKRLLCGILEVPSLPMDLAFHIDEFNAEGLRSRPRDQGVRVRSTRAEEAAAGADRRGARGGRRDRLRRGRAPARGGRGAGPARRRASRIWSSTSSRRSISATISIACATAESVRRSSTVPLLPACRAASRRRRRPEQQAARDQADHAGDERRQQDAELGDLDQRPRRERQGRDEQRHREADAGDQANHQDA